MGLDSMETCTTCGAIYPVGKPHICEPFNDTDSDSIEVFKVDGSPKLELLSKQTGDSPDLSKGLKFDTGKLQYSLIPPETTKALAEVLTFGATKYGPNNWQIVEDGNKRYLDALFRHLEAYRSGEEIDPESGLHHLAHALTNVAFLHYLETN